MFIRKDYLAKQNISEVSQTLLREPATDRVCAAGKKMQLHTAYCRVCGPCISAVRLVLIYCTHCGIYLLTSTSTAESK